MRIQPSSNVERNVNSEPKEVSKQSNDRQRNEETVERTRSKCVHVPRESPDEWEWGSSEMHAGRMCRASP
jgi:hypothetical protein